jgi:antitoxin VapB
MIIASTRIEGLARRLARATGEDLETAVARALEERLSRVAPAEKPDRRAALEKFLAAAASHPVLDDRPPDEILGYGPDGLPD